ncbi:recombinase family protein [Catellatospora sp. TT07R-123]|uniref:recombinase family protein n=1 Tax=Catellatospora sp. TT07R-123 TaxID=2733863 RepID=UPI001BB33486|nr:recombinase family protein [Catellatospora sp. TT07R-123]
MSTKEWQHRLSSGRWQRDFAEDVVRGHGEIVAEYFDLGRRVRPWHQRPQASMLLAALTDPDRLFNAVVIGEFERAFYGNHFKQILPLFAENGVQLWLPEIGGPVDPASHEHMAVLELLGVHSKREIQRARFRAKAAMRAQVIEQGRHQGGRPPFGYRLVRAGLHPNPAHAKWGRPAFRLDPDSRTAHHVQWIFAQRIAGRSVANIAKLLNERGVPCPSRVDPDRNPHRSGEVWVQTTVRSILENARYTGRQVWNRQQTEQGPLDAADDLLGRSENRRWNLIRDWAISKVAVHPPLVSERDFVMAQLIRSVPAPKDATSRIYALAGLVWCQMCGRKFDSHWSHGNPAYRCRHGQRSDKPGGTNEPWLYIREDDVVRWVAELLRLSHEPETIAVRLRADGSRVLCGPDRKLSLDASVRSPARIPRPRSPKGPATPPRAGTRAFMEFY